MNTRDKKHQANLDEALKRGDKLYKGKPCVRGHSGWRYTSNGNCHECQSGKDSHYARRKAENRDKSREHNAKYREKNPERMLWHTARARAKRKGQIFTIEPHHVVIPELCPVFNTPIDTPSIDRFDNTLGYTPDNIRVISKRANTLKSNGSLADFEAICAYLKKG